MYILFNGRHYLDEKHNPCTRDKAHRFNTIKTANNFLSSSPKTIQNLNYQPLEVSDEIIVEQEKVKIGEIKQKNNSISPNNIYKQFDDNLFSSMDIDKCVVEYQNFLQQSFSAKEELTNQLTLVEKEIQDILHAAEFFTLNASQGYMIYKMLHEARIKRRKIKDMILKTDIISESTLADWKSGRVVSRIKGIQNREYQPRVLQELFK